MRKKTIFCFLSAALLSLSAYAAAPTSLASPKISLTLKSGSRKEFLTKLDKLNQNQNQVRKRLQSIGQDQQELKMAADNIALEVQRQKEQEKLTRQRVSLLLKMVYRIHRDGALKFFLSGGNISLMVNRARIVYRTLRSHSAIVQQMRARSLRLIESETKLAEAQNNLLRIASELKEQEGLLGTLLEQKRVVLSNFKTEPDLTAKPPEQEAVKSLFAGIDKKPKTDSPSRLPSGLLPPVEGGTLVKRFGKTIDERFGTVIIHRGIEMAAEHKSPVRAVTSGTVEFEGWVTGLGNAVVITHPGNYYSLSAHLFESQVKAGDKVEPGQVIGSVGDTGINSDPSLYFELRHKGKPIDPLPLLEVKVSKR